MSNLSNCAVNLLKKEDTDFTCFSYEELVKIADALNGYNGSICQIKNTKKCIDNLDENRIDIDKYKRKYDLWNAIDKKLKKLCKKEYCWVQLDFINSIKDPDLKHKLKYFTFKPIGTKSEKDWLNTDHINEILDQYAFKYRDFKFLGAVPADYHHISKPNYKRLIRNNKYIGIVFNTDIHTEPGQHWTSCFIDNEHKTIEYFDSLGNKPNKYMRDFINRFTKKRSYKLTINNIKHQKNSSLCGIYSCYFIIQRLKGNTFNQINANIITDKYMAKCKKEYFLSN